MAFVRSRETIVDTRAQFPEAWMLIGGDLNARTGGLHDFILNDYNENADFPEEYISVLQRQIFYGWTSEFIWPAIVWIMCECIAENHKKMEDLAVMRELVPILAMKLLEVV